MNKKIYIVGVTIAVLSVSFLAFNMRMSVDLSAVSSVGIEPVESESINDFNLLEEKNGQSSDNSATVLNHVDAQQIDSKFVENQQQLNQMILDYEEAKFEEDTRNAHKEAMKQKLAQYNEDVLSVVLRKIEGANERGVTD